MAAIPIIRLMCGIALITNILSVSAQRFLNTEPTGQAGNTGGTVRTIKKEQPRAESPLRGKDEAAQSRAGITAEHWTAKDSDVYWNATIYNPKGLLITDVGVIVYYGGHTKTFTQECPAHLNTNVSVPLSYGMIHDLEIPILPVTGYEYKFFAVIGGVRYEAGQCGFCVGPDVSQYTHSAADDLQEMDTQVPYYCVNDPVFNGKARGYRTCAMAMVLGALDIPKATLEELLAFNGGTVFLKSFTLLEKHYGVTIEPREFTQSGAARETELTEILMGLTSGRRAVYVNVRSDYGAHAVVAYLDAAGLVRFNDPGVPGAGTAFLGEDITLAEDAMFLNETDEGARWDALGTIWIVRRVN